VIAVAILLGLYMMSCWIDEHEIEVTTTDDHTYYRVVERPKD